MSNMDFSSELIRNVNNVKELSNLISNLGYRTNPQPLHIPSLDLPESAQKIIRELHIISDYDQKFQIYFGKTTSMRRTDFRNILEPFYRRYPQINSLFIFTENWEEIAFVSPERVATEPKKVKLLLRILLIDPQNVYHTDIEVLNNIFISPDEQKPEVIWRKHSEAFSVERVTKEFFEAYKSALRFIKEEILIPQKKASYQEVHSFSQQLLSRIMFLYYVQKKGWLKWKDYVRDKRYIRNLWERYKQSQPKKDTFYSLWLSSLFFHAFNKKHQYLTLNIPDEIKESFNLMPFLNGGLFTENELDEIGFKVPDEIFRLLFETDPLDKKMGFLERYNFTIREDTPLEVEVAVDPEMLGKVYESLISEEERGKGGIFYTPRIEIDYMCRLSLVEYLSEETKIPKTDLIPWVFEPQRILDEPDSSIKDLRRIKETIDRVKIVDPAVGSASFLVGMMNVLVEIQRNLSLKIDKREENLFALKNKVLSENLYGVDVKDWAVMVGELRLWLSLIIETEEKFMDIYTKPLLPNLTFKMRQGDSLVEEIAGIPVPLRGKFAYIPKPVKDKITMLVDRKVEYFRGGRSADLKEKDEIERLENEVLKEIVGSEIKRLEDEENQLKGKISDISKQYKKQPDIFKEKQDLKDLSEEEIKKLKKRIEEISPEKERLSILLKEIGNKTRKDYFLWEVDFAEIFAEKGGFDIVFSNPPYVRQEMIAFPLEREEDYEAEEWRERKRLYKEKLAQSVKMHWGESVKIDKKSDLYVYFYYHGLALLRPGGVFCFINSNSWLDVGYGAGLQEFLIKNMEPVYIIDNLAKRTFAESDVNTVIVLIKRPAGRTLAVAQNDILKFIAFKKPFEEVLKPDTLINIEQAQGKVFAEDYRVFPKTRFELLEEGIEIPEEGEKELIKGLMNFPYVGNKWGGKYLRAPEIFFKILKKGKGKLVRLGDIAEVRFGVKTGANEFFYLEPTGKPAPKGLIHVKNGAGWEGLLEEDFLKPIIKSPRECRSIIIKSKDLKYKVFMCPESKSNLRNTFALKYIEWGERQGYHKKPTCRNRQRWWELEIPVISDFLWTMTYRDRFFVAKNKITFADARFYYMYSEPELGAVANTSYCLLWMELQARGYGGGGGPVDVKVYEVQNLQMPRISPAGRERLLVAFKQIGSRNIKSIFEEIGFTLCDKSRCKIPEHPYEFVDPNKVSLDKVLPDRRELDRIVFEALGLTEEEQLEVYRAVVELVKNRLVKARSV